MKKIAKLISKFYDFMFRGRFAVLKFLILLATFLIMCEFATEAEPGTFMYYIGWGYVFVLIFTLIVQFVNKKLQE